MPKRKRPDYAGVEKKMKNLLAQARSRPEPTEVMVSVPKEKGEWAGQRLKEYKRAGLSDVDALKSLRAEMGKSQSPGSTPQPKAPSPGATYGLPSAESAMELASKRAKANQPASGGYQHNSPAKPL